jgi:hypothetical protein
MRLVPISTLVVLVASFGRTASAQVSEDLAIPDIRVEGRVEYRAETGPAAGRPGWLKTLLFVRATGAEGAKLEYGGCPFTVRMYASPARVGRPRWDYLDIPNVICTLELTIARLSQGQEDTLSALTHPEEVLGDSLAPGRYYVAAFVRPNRDSLLLDAGAVDLHP